MQRDQRQIVVVALSLLAAGLLSIPLAYAYVRYRERAADRIWAESFEPMDTLVGRYPPTEDSPSVKAVAETCARLGIQLLARELQTTRDSPASEQNPSEAAFKLLASHVDAVRAQAENRVDAPPEELQRYLTSHRQDISVVVRQLLSETQPLTWAANVAAGWSAPLPPIQGIGRLHQLLLVTALHESCRGEKRASFEALEASWKLLTAVRRRPELIAQLAAAVMAANQSGI